MHIQLHPTACLNERGKRENNEDSIYPLAGHATAATQLFMVCDGVGGSAKGEEASRLACQSFVAYFMSKGFPQPLPNSADYINAALQYTEAAFDASLAANPNQKGMGTTVTLVCLHEGGITAAHIGDSRIYHVRKGAILWATIDHSLVNDYLKAGIITPEDAIDHPQKNVITRAVQGASVRPTRADVHIITDIAADDYIFMCTDGILESISDYDLCRILGDSHLMIEDQIAAIHHLCNDNSRDNFSCYLLKIASVQGQITPQYGLITAQNAAETPKNEVVLPIITQNTSAESAVIESAAIESVAIESVAIESATIENSIIENSTAETTAFKNNQIKYAQIAFGIILLGLTAFFAMNYFKNKPQPSPKPTPIQKEKPAVIPAVPPNPIPAKIEKPASQNSTPAKLTPPKTPPVTVKPVTTAPLTPPTNTKAEPTTTTKTETQPPKTDTKIDLEGALKKVNEETKMGPTVPPVPR